MNKIKQILFGFLCILVAASCTENFDDINTEQTGFNSDEVSAKFFLTSTQVELYGPARFTYWRAQLIHADRYAGQFNLGHSGSWWDDGLSYTYNPAYTDATYDWLADHFGSIKSFGDLTTTGGDLENEYMYAMSLIMKGLFFQKYTDIFGMVPFSEAGVDGILTPKYDTQKDIYKGIIADLDEAISLIGSTERTGVGVNDAAENDVYCGGDLQQWKRLANTLKLRIGMRALGSPGDDFATGVINAAMAAPLLDEVSGSVVMKKDFVIRGSTSSYGDIWWDFGDADGAQWTLSNILINMLKDNNDPRLTKYAKPAGGGMFEFEDNAGDATKHQERLDFIVATLDDAGANYTMTTNGAKTNIEMPAGQFVGQPIRINANTKSYVKTDLFSPPGDFITHKRGSQIDAYEEVILTSAEAYFLQAEATVRGIGSGDAQALMNLGIKESMKMWGISDGEANTYSGSQAITDISAGTMDEKLEKIATQRWLASYTDGFEAWSVVRKTGYPAELAAGVLNSNPTIFALGTLNGEYPQRLRYGTSAQQGNPNFGAALNAQGADSQRTTLWFAK